MNLFRLQLFLTLFIGGLTVAGEASAQKLTRRALFPKATLGCSCVTCGFHKGAPQKGVPQKGTPQKGTVSKGTPQKGCAPHSQKAGGGCTLCINMQPLLDGVGMMGRALRCHLCGMTSGMANALGQFASRSGCANCSRSKCSGGKGCGASQVPVHGPGPTITPQAPRTPQPPQPDPFVDDPPTQAFYGQSVILRTSRTARPFGGNGVRIHVTDR